MPTSGSNTAQGYIQSCSISFSSLIAGYAALQSSLMTQVRNLASSMSTANPASFILIQFEMSQVTQVGDSISNMIAQVNSVINHAVQNQRVS